MLTFETIRKIVMEERGSKTLAALPDDFFDSVQVYFEKKSQVSREGEDHWEIDTAKRWLQDLLEIRERKLLSQALFYVRSGAPSPNMTPEEKEFFDRMVSALREFQKKRAFAYDKMQEKKMAVALLQDIPRFVAINTKEFGPYRKGDIVSIPEENAKVLVEKGIAQELMKCEVAEGS